MRETIRLLRGIMKTSGWTQEQVAEKLGVSFATLNAWLNGRARPRTVMRDRIRMLYLAQDITKDTDPTYITLVNVPRWLKVGEIVVLEKEPDNSFDDEAISATIIDSDGDEGDELIEDNEEFEGRVGIEILDCPEVDFMYVANSINTVVRGTKSAGRIYDRFDKKARARVLFVLRRMAIARVVEWDYDDKKVEKRC